MSSRKRNKVIEEFIESYKSEPCLWRVKSKEYHERAKRDAAYEKLAQKLKELEPEADKATVVKKINNLRSNVRKEKKKYEASIKSGTSADEIYRPTLWYYNLFDFLGDQDTPRTSHSNVDEEESDNEELFDNQESLLNEGEGSSKNADIDFMDSEDLGLFYNAEERSTTQNENEKIASQGHCARPSKRKCDQLANDVLLPVWDRLKRSAAQEDRYDLLGKTIALKLRALHKHKRLIAEKIINDILFEAEMDNFPSHFYQNRNTPGYMQHYRTTNPTFSPSPRSTTSPCPNPISHPLSVSPTDRYTYTPPHSSKNSASEQSPLAGHSTTIELCPEV